MTNPLSPVLNIKHSDWPYILQIFSLYIILSTVAIVGLAGVYQLFILLFLTAFLIVLTIVHHYRLQREESEYQHYKIQAIGEIQKLLSFRAPLPAMNGWAATPELSVTVLKEIIRNKPNIIVELGSGVTTLINAYGLEKYNPKGRVISIDHDAEYANITKNEFELHGLQKVVDLRVAPLKTVNVNNSSHVWYDSAVLKFEQKIDLLIVDGPPVKTEKYARYPALPLLNQYLSESCTIIIHDTKRSQESTIIKKWIQEFPSFREEKLRTDKGISILSR